MLQRVTHFNNWTVAHAHLALFGFSGFIALGALYHILPLVIGRRLWSSRLVNLQFGLVLFGIIGFFIVLTAAGLVQGHSWENGEVIYRVLPTLSPYMISRAVLGLFILTGAVVGLYNVLRSIREGEPLPVEGKPSESPL